MRTWVGIVVACLLVAFDATFAATSCSFATTSGSALSLTVKASNAAGQSLASPPVNRTFVSPSLSATTLYSTRINLTLSSLGSCTTTVEIRRDGVSLANTTGVSFVDYGTVGGTTYSYTMRPTYVESCIGPAETVALSATAAPSVLNWLSTLSVRGVMSARSANRVVYPGSNTRTSHSATVYEKSGNAWSFAREVYPVGTDDGDSVLITGVAISADGSRGLFIKSNRKIVEVNLGTGAVFNSQTVADATAVDSTGSAIALRSDNLRAYATVYLSSFPYIMLLTRASTSSAFTQSTQTYLSSCSFSTASNKMSNYDSISASDGVYVAVSARGASNVCVVDYTNTASPVVTTIATSYTVGEVAMNADGTRLFVSNGNTGGAASMKITIYTRSGSTWSAGATYTDAAYQTSNAIAVNSAGNTLCAITMDPGNANNAMMTMYTYNGSAFSRLFALPLGTSKPGSSAEWANVRTAMVGDGNGCAANLVYSVPLAYIL